MEANAICLDCGTAKEDPENGFCINGHDNWVEDGDDVQRISYACEKFQITGKQLMHHIKNNVSVGLPTNLNTNYK